MDAAAFNVPMNLESVAATLMVDEENGDGGETVAPLAKKQRFCDEINRVAEIVLVLSALGRIRGGKTPTELELELMVEARSMLAAMCEEFTPMDIIGKDDVRAVIEDLGLNDKAKDQRLGFRAPKLTISEKLSLGKRKMEEEAKKYLTPTVVSTGYASPGFAKNVHVAHQWPSGEVNSSGSHFRMERPPQVMMVNGVSQGTATSSANYYAASWSAQPQSTISFSTAPDKKVPVQSSVRAADTSFRPFMSQNPHGTFPSTNQPMQGMHYGHTSSFGNNHSVIAKIIHKVLQPLVKQYALWNPPSRDYMSRAIACQMCEVTINEVETLLICDACEKAYHLKCLQGNNMKGVPTSEWHCSRCVQAFNGKPFPPKYGPTISTTAAKRPSSTAGVQSSISKKVGSMDMKVNQQKPIVSTGPGVQNFPAFVSGAARTSHFETANVTANTTASAAKTTNTGRQGFRESLICGTNSTALVSLTVTPNPIAIASTSAVINNGLASKPLTPVGTMSSTYPLPAGNQVPVNGTSNAMTASLAAQALAVAENGDSSSVASGTADHSILNTDLTTQVHALTVTSDINSQLAVSHSETVKAIEDVNPSESTSHSDSHCLNDKTTSENGQELSKDGKKKFALETCQNHPTDSPAAVISDQDRKITAKPSVPQENSAYQTEKKASQPPLVPSSYHSQSEKETPNVQESLQNVPPGDSQKGEGVNGLDDRHKEQPSEPGIDKPASIKEANAA
ncbi:unnamed protein product [Arabis nemorensis]|uniref:PHD-type domain-containing protein n=1 Tax=Arabis nemorensis TaxID=586526 RepID=A0A565BCD0_9BRAS|nr:unnamed protein product [Arabis nemorensis]